MAKVINLKFAGKCADCGAHLPKGTRAKYYGRGRVYGLYCHPKPAEREAESEFKRSNGACEDAPCCGCCGPQGDGDYYGTYAAEQANEPWDGPDY